MDNPHDLPKRLARALSATAFALLAACGPADAQHEASAPEPTAPSAEQLRLATHPGYATPPGVRQECLGRLVLDTPRDIEWGLSRPGLWSGDHFRFTETMHGDDEHVDIGNIGVVVLAPAKWSDIERMQSGTNAEKSIAIREYRNEIKGREGTIERLSAIVEDPSLNINNNDISKYPASIERQKKEIAEIESHIAGLQSDYHPIDLGLPQSLGYAAGPTLYAFILRDGRAYQFMSTGGDHAPSFEVRQAAFFDFLKRFRTRALYEIPKEPGICFPYGFVADDGTSHSGTVVSFRFKDRPGVIYTFGAQVAGELGFEGEAALVQATSTATAGRMGIGRDPKTLGPRQFKIGALPGWQGGFSLNIAPEGKPEVRSYELYAGTEGHPHSRALPAIRLVMRSFTREQERSLKSDPPPIGESSKRFDALVDSIRLRPTDPVMPELTGIVKQ
jgi:hypothetical protein